MTAAAPARPGKAATTRGGLLSSARSVFTASGFAEASIAEVVAGAGASVGSLYHHFGGKADLYLAMFEDHAVRQEERATAAVPSFFVTTSVAAGFRARWARASLRSVSARR